MRNHQHLHHRAVMDSIPKRVAQMSDAQFTPELRGRILCRLAAECAVDLSDSELERCLAPCVSGTMLVRVAKMYRDCGYMTDEWLQGETWLLEAFKP